MITARKWHKYLSAKLTTFLQYDLSRTEAFEFTFAISVGFLIYANYSNILGLGLRPYIASLVIFWAVLAMRGFFIPAVRESWVISVSSNKPPGIPILVQLESRGGFIAGRKISFKAQVIQLQDDRDSIAEFHDMYSKYSVVFFNSIRLPIESGKFLQGQPQAGGIELNQHVIKDKITILFSTPGEYQPMFLFEKKGDPKPYGGPMPENLLNQKLKVSPAENWVALRNYAITYALTLIILLLSLVQLQLV